jgi:DNA replication protein DnaC
MDSFKDITEGLNIERKPAIWLVSTDSRVCTRCRGVGYLRTNVPFGHRQFGKAQECECTKAAKKAKQQQKLLEISGIMNLEQFRDASFANFNYKLPGCRGAMSRASAYAGKPSGWLVMLGIPGCGKTHLAVSIAKRRIEAGDTVLVQTVPDLLDYLSSAFSPQSEQSYDKRFEEVKSVDLLILDDYCAQNDTSWATVRLFQLFNHRYNRKLATVINSNNISLNGIDSRIYSRLCDQKLVTIVKMEGARDYRIYGDSDE